MNMNAMCEMVEDNKSICLGLPNIQISFHFSWSRSWRFKLLATPTMQKKACLASEDVSKLVLSKQRQHLHRIQYFILDFRAKLWIMTSSVLPQKSLDTSPIKRQIKGPLCQPFSLKAPSKVEAMARLSCGIYGVKSKEPQQGWSKLHDQSQLDKKAVDPRATSLNFQARAAPCYSRPV